MNIDMQVEHLDAAMRQLQDIQSEVRTSRVAFVEFESSSLVRNSVTSS